MKRILLILILLGLGAFASAQNIENTKHWADNATFFYRVWTIENIESNAPLMNLFNEMAKDGWEITMIPLPMSPDRKYPNTAHILITFRKR